MIKLTVDNFLDLHILIKILIFKVIFGVNGNLILSMNVKIDQDYCYYCYIMDTFCYFEPYAMKNQEWMCP